MSFKEKVIGLILIVAGLFPFILKIPTVGDYFVKYKFLTYLVPGEIAYQLIIVVLGCLLIWRVKSKVEVRG